MGIYKN